MATAFEATIGLGDTYGTRAEVSVEEEDESAQAVVYVALLAGLSGGRGFATPMAARQLAGVLIDAADAAEGSS